MTTATSGTNNFVTTRDGIINRALRITGELGTGESANSTRITEAAEALGDMVKAWQADGMPLWKIVTYSPFSYTTAYTYTISTDSTAAVVAPAPLKILYAYNRNTATTPNLDTPVILVSKEDYERLGNKATTGRPNQVYYQTPGPAVGITGTTSNPVGTIYVYPAPDTYSVSNVDLVIIGQRPFEDFDASADVPDFPQYWYNAVKWGLAAELCHEGGLPYQERQMIMANAKAQKDLALSFGTEEGSLFLQPRPHYGMDDHRVP